MRRTLDPVTLRLFVAVCEERNIARAAAREAIVASAVSKRIAALEQAVGTTLLVRGRRGIVPTAAGEALLRRAHELLGSMERLHAELSEFATGAHGSVRVVASLSVLAEQLPDDIASFLARYQAVRVSLDERVSPEVVRSVREGAADIGVLWDALEMSGLHTVPYRFDHLCVAVHPLHRFASRKRVRFADTIDEVEHRRGSRRHDGRDAPAPGGAARAHAGASHPGVEPRRRVPHRRRRARHRGVAARSHRAARQRVGPGDGAAGRAVGGAALRHLLARRRGAVGHHEIADRPPAPTGARAG